MRYLLAASLLCYAQTAVAADPIRNAMSVFWDEMTAGRIAICKMRDRDHAAATEQAYANWKTVNAALLGEIRTGREKLDANFKARAVTAASMLYREAAMTLDASMREQCALWRTDWMKREPDQQLVDARALLRQMRDATTPE